jgi:UTP--glucose-1-phosphate uridylyltransferase
MARVRVTSVDQPRQLGLGDAVRHARAFVAEEPFLCQLGDAIFSPRSAGGRSPSEQLVAAHRELGTAVIGVEEVPPDKVERYGIVGGKEIRPGVLRLDTLVEKPRLAEAPSRLAIAARYLLTPRVFDCLDRTRAGAGGEVQLTDAIKLLLAREPVHAVVLEARRHDIGSPLDWLKTNIVFAARDEKLWPHVAPLVRQLLDDG